MSVAAPSDHERIRLAVGRGEVIISNDDVRTVAIAEPKIADAAVGSQRSVVVNAKSPGITTLVVYNEGARYKIYDIEVYVPNSDKQVALHSTLAEVSDEARHQLGFDWVGGVTSTTPWLDGTATGGLFPLKATSDTRDGFITYVRTKGDMNLSVQWQALKQNGDLRELANPTLVARSGGQASFLAGGEFPVPIATGGGATVGAVVPQTVTIEWKQFGVRLEFTPTIMENGSILMDISTEVSALNFNTSVKVSGFDLPSIDTRKAKTQVVLQPNEYLVMGGLKQTESVRVVKKVPILGEIPLLGFFFSSSNTQKTEKDLLVVVSPEIVSSANAMPALPTDTPMPSEPGKK
ncbi:MAG: type II and III secretion system protein family protein [Candidatus Eisenbacteria bacterium]